MKYVINDGFNSELVKNAFFDGELEIPIIKKQNGPCDFKKMVPFTCINKVDGREEVLCFYENDSKFNDFTIHPDRHIGEITKFSAVISLDNSLYWDMPLCLQIADIYFNRAIGHYLQEQGFYVIPNIRWGDERTYTTEVLPEKVAFLGVEKNSIVSIGDYGQISDAEKKCQFRKGLIAMLDEIEPKIVLVYGPNSPKIFDGLYDKTNFVFFDDWITSVKGGNSTNGNN